MKVPDLAALEAMQRVEPACDTVMKMLEEMKPLSLEDKCKLMRRRNVIANFCNLNPSLIEAMRLFRHPSGKVTVSPAQGQSGQTTAPLHHLRDGAELLGYAYCVRGDTRYKCQGWQLYSAPRFRRTKGQIVKSFTRNEESSCACCRLS
jgi:hypothetical protein